MKNNPDESKLINAALSDEMWNACSARLEAEGLSRFRAARRSRARWQAVAQISALLLLTGTIARYALQTRHSQTTQAAAAPKTSVTDAHSNASPVSGDHRLYITEQEMLALFPKGSCIVAEVNGQKELVFLDRRNDSSSAPKQN